MSAEDARIALTLIAIRQLGRPYIWGGDGSDEGGLDCSGFVGDCLTQLARSWPKLYSGGRRTSSGLYAYFTAIRGCLAIRQLKNLRPGCLVFYSKEPDGKIYHVAIHLATFPEFDEGRSFGPLSIEAGGGGSKNKDPRDSLRNPAGVRFAASDVHGKAAWRAVDPFWLLEEAER